MSVTSAVVVTSPKKPVNVAERRFLVWRRVGRRYIFGQDDIIVAHKALAISQDSKLSVAT